MAENKIIKELMHDSNIGCSITELVLRTKLTRSSIRTSLARMEGAGIVTVRKIGMAKVYILNQKNPENIVSGKNPAIENNNA